MLSSEIKHIETYRNYSIYTYIYNIYCIYISIIYMYSLVHGFKELKYAWEFGKYLVESSCSFLMGWWRYHFWAMYLPWKTVASWKMLQEQAILTRRHWDCIEYLLLKQHQDQGCLTLKSIFFSELLICDDFLDLLYGPWRPCGRGMDMERIERPRCLRNGLAHAQATK